MTHVCVKHIIFIPNVKKRRIELESQVKTERKKKEIPDVCNPIYAAPLTSM